MKMPLNLNQTTFQKKKLTTVHEYFFLPAGTESDTIAIYRFALICHHSFKLWNSPFSTFYLAGSYFCVANFGAWNLLSFQARSRSCWNSCLTCLSMRVPSPRCLTFVPLLLLLGTTSTIPPHFKSGLLWPKKKRSSKQPRWLVGCGQQHRA